MAVPTRIRLSDGGSEELIEQGRVRVEAKRHAKKAARLGKRSLECAKS